MKQARGKLAQAVLMGGFLLLLAAPVLAQGTYFGVGFGKSKVDFEDFEPGATAVSDESTVVKVVAGYELTRYVAIEAFYIDLRDYSIEGPIGTLEATADGPGVTVVAFLPITEKTRLLAKAGVVRWDASHVATIPGLGTDSGRKNDYDPVFGLGLHFDGPNPAASVRLEFERFKDIGKDILTGKDDGYETDVMSLSIIYNF